MRFKVLLKKSVENKLRKLPNIRLKFDALAWLLSDAGPAGAHGWSNYGKLNENEYHCHLSYHYVACWRYEKKTIIIEVTYVGSHEDAPY
jgi:mRNA-degrading endonuclease RelE of RelBE toxin-antitoxin system